MNRLAARVLGFALPTVSLVTALHLDKQASGGEALDGVVSGVCFTLPFALVTWVRSRLKGGRASAPSRGAGREFALGMLAGVVTWAAVWLGWSMPAVQGLRPHAFGLNSAAMAVAGLLLPPAGRSERGLAPADTAGVTAGTP